MIDLTKIACKLHSSEYINIFCAQNTCRMPLCPTCVCQHTQMHLCCRTQPIYQNIRSTYSRVHEEISSQLEVIKQDKVRLTALFDSIKAQKQNFKETLELAKQDCLNLVIDFFIELEKKWEADMSMQQKKNSLHNGYRLQALSEMLTKQMEKLIDQSKKMNTSGFLERIQTLEKEVLIQSQDFHKKFSEEIDQNQQYRPSINYLKGNVGQLKMSLERILKLEYNIPIQRLLNFSWNKAEEKRMVPSYSTWKFKDMSSQKAPKQQNKDLFNVSTFVKKVSTQKPVIQAKILQSNSSLFIGVPRVLTTSVLHSCSTPITPKMINSVVPIENSSILSLKNDSIYKTNPKNSGLSTEKVDTTGIHKFQRAMSNKSGVKVKKNGLSLTGCQSQCEKATLNKQNNKKI